MLLPNETTVATPIAVSVYVWLWLQIIENIGISASLSAIKPDYQAFVVYTPNFTPSFGREIGCFVWGLKGEKKGIKIFILPFVPSKKKEYGSTPTLV